MPTTNINIGTTANDWTWNTLRAGGQVINDNFTVVQSDLTTHINDSTNPHSVTKTQVGLSNADNTSDANKPVSSATQTEIDTKEDTLVSGTNIKTINWDSIVWSWNLVITAVAPVDSVNWEIGAVILDADDISDAATTNKYTTAWDISKLAWIEAGAEVNNISDANATDLTDAGDSTLHYHSTDRTRANHTGTQAAPTITLDDTDLIVADTTNLQTFAQLTDKAVTRARGTGVAISYVSTVAVGGTTFAQPAIEGEITSDEGYFQVSYAGATGITVADLNASSTWVYIDKNNALQQQTTTPTRQDRTRKAFTMRIAVNTSTNLIIGFEYDNNPIGHYANSMRDLYEFLLLQGVPFKKDQLITGRATDLGFDISSGQLLEFGGTGDINNPNIKDFDAVAQAEFFLSTRTGFDAGGNTLLPKFWDNAGSLTALGSGTLVWHRLFRFSNGNVALQYGQANYANIQLAKAGAPLEEYVLNPALKNATFFGWWFINETATNTGGTTLTDFRDYTIGTQGGSSSSLSGALLVGNNLSDLLDTAVARANIGLSTTANQTDSSNKRFMTDAQETNLDNQSNSNSGDNATNSSSATAAQGTTADNALQSADIWVTVQGYDANTTKNAATQTLTNKTLTSWTNTFPVFPIANWGTNASTVAWARTNLSILDGELFKYSIVRTVASGNLTVALKNYLWNDPSVAVPVKVQIDWIIFTITSPSFMTVTVTDWANNFNSWSSELATKEIDYFIYLCRRTSNDDIYIMMSRIPYWTVWTDFSNTNTNEKRGWITNSLQIWVTSVSGVVNIWRFNATLSAWAAYTWSVPASSIILNEKILQTRYLDYTPVGTWYTAGGAKYRIDWNNLNIIIDSTANITGDITTPFSSTNTVDNQFITSAGTARLPKNSNSIIVATNPQNISWFYWI
jgi:hypothetical protein